MPQRKDTKNAEKSTHHTSTANVNNGASTYDPGQIQDKMASEDKILAGMKRLESKVDKVNSKVNQLSKAFDEKLKDTKDDIFLEISGLRSRIDSLESQLTKVNIAEPDGKPPFEPTRTVIVIGLPEHRDENIAEKIAELMTKGLELPVIEPVDMIRLKSRSEKPGLVKVEFTSVDDKVNILRAKRKLREHASYRHVFLAGCKSHTERLLELNMKAVLSELPNGDNYTFTGSGRLVKRDAQRPTQQKRPRASASTSSYSGNPVKHQRRDSATHMPGQQEKPIPRDVR